MDTVFRCISVIGLIFFLCSSIACSDDTQSYPPPSPDNDSNADAEGDEDAGSTAFDSGPLVDVGSPGSGDESDDETIDCTADSSLGTLSSGDQGTVDVALHPVDSEELVCSDIDGDGAAHNLSFYLDSPSLIQWTRLHDGDAERVGFHALGDDCDTDAPCQSGQSAEFAHSAGAQLLRIEMAEAASSETIHFQVDEAICDNPGQGWCEDGTYRECYQGTSIDDYPCADDRCGVADSCIADSCTDALSIQPGTPSSPTVIDGHRQGYSHTGHLEDFEGCELDNVESHSAELFFAIDDIPDNRTLVVESLAQGTYGFFILSDCDVAQCLEVGSADENFENRIRWESDGATDSAIVAIRPSDPVSRTFSFSFYFDESN